MLRATTKGPQFSWVIKADIYKQGLMEPTNNKSSINDSCLLLKINYMLFYKQRFFSTQPQCRLTFWQIELHMLLRCPLILHYHYYTETYFISSIFVPISRPMFINVMSLWSILIFSVVFIFINHITSLKQTHLAFLQFLKYLLLFLDQKANNFQIAEVQPQSVA